MSRGLGDVYKRQVGTVTLVIEVVQVLVLIGSVILVEKALKRTFDENGNRRG